MNATMKTFESCGLTWFECNPATVKPDWLPDEAVVRWLTCGEFAGDDEYQEYSRPTAIVFFGRIAHPPYSVDVAGWYPVDESLIPAEPLTRDDSLPEGVPPPPEGWRFYGMGPVKERGPRECQMPPWITDIAMWDEGRWDMTAWSGNDKSRYYAIREGSDLYKKIWPTETVSPVLADDSSDECLAILLSLSHEQKAWKPVPGCLKDRIRAVLNDLEPARVQRIMRVNTTNNQTQP